MKNSHVLVIDDEEAQANIIASILQKEGYIVEKVYSAEEGLRLQSKREFNVILVDMKMPGMGGLEFLRKVKEEGYATSVIVMTAYGTIETAVDAMRADAFDYVTKPFRKEELLISVERAVSSYNLYHQNARLKEQLETIYEGRKLIGNSQSIRKIHELIQKVAATDNASVLITGESGTGKELVARAIHGNSRRYDMPFVAVNCSAIPVNLLESELFGYEKGAFTGADSKREGKFKRADGGTVFLDEIADMPLNMQAKILRVIQDGEVAPVGGDELLKVDVRIISATNKNIDEMIGKGEFRDDLFYRLNVVPIHIPPLRKRRDDIPVLIEHIKSSLNRKLKKNIEIIPESVIERLKAYDFPGNVRELENMLERAFILSDHDTLNVEMFPMPRNRHDGTGVPDDELSLKEVSKRARDRAERETIVRVLTETKWNRVQAAKLLKVDYKTLRQKIRDLDIEPHFMENRRERWQSQT